MRIRYQIMLLIVVVLGVYYPSLTAPLNSVDDPGMYSYLLNTDDFTLRGVFMPGGVYYRPLLLLTFLFDKYIWGLEVSFMHLDNILLHLCNAMLVYAITRKSCFLTGQQTVYLPLAAAILFASHPINTESVIWISGRTDLLAGFFILLTVFLSLKRPLPIVLSLISACCLLLACLSKETAIFFLPAAVVIPFFLSADPADAPTIGETFRRYLPHGMLFGLIGAGYLAFRRFAISGGDQGIARVVTHVAGKQSADLMISVQMVLKAIGFYAKKLVMPFPLNFAIVHVSDIYILIGVAVCVCIAWLVTRRRSLPGYFFLSALSIATSTVLILLLRITWTPLAERYMYIPAAFFVVGSAMTIQQWRHYRRYHKQLVAIVAVVTVISLYGTFTRNLIWQDNLGLYQDTVRKSPGFMPAQNELATALQQHGKANEALKIYQSFQMCDDVINSQYGMMNKAGAFADNNDFVGARHVLENILKNPGKLEVAILEKMLEINKIEIMRGKTTGSAIYADSVKRLTRLYELTGNPFYQYRLGVVHLHEKKNELARQSFNTVVRTAPPTAYYRKPAEKLAKDLAKGK